MGATSTKVSLVKYETVENPKKKSDKYQHVTIVAEESIDDFGGRALDNIIANELMDRYNKLEKRKGKQDIRSNPKVVQRFLKQAQKVKEILSANKQARINMMDVEKIQFKEIYSREEFEKAAQESIFKRVTQPIQAVIKSAGLENKDISQIQLLGGGIRVPRIQNEIKEFFKDTLASLEVSNQTQQKEVEQQTEQTTEQKEGQEKQAKQEKKQAEQEQIIRQIIGTNLNGDEAMCHGAAFIAANSTTTRFSVKQVKLVEYNPFEYHMNINFKDSEKDPMKRKLFSQDVVLGQKKKLSFGGMNDFQIEVYIKHNGQNQSSDEYVVRYSVSIDEEKRKMLEHLNQEGKVKENSIRTVIRFELSRSGIVELTEANVEYIMLNEYQKKVKKQPVIVETTQGEKKEDESKENEEKKDGEEKKDDEEKKEDEKQQENAEESKQDKKQEETKDEQSKPEQPQTPSKQKQSPKKQNQKKQPEYEYITDIKEIPNKLPFTYSKTRLTNNLTPEQIQQMKEKLKSFDKIDKRIKKTAETLSTFQSLIYSVRDEIDDYQNYMDDTTYVKISEDVRVQMNWIEDQGFNADLEEIQQRKREIQQEWNKVLSRKKNYAELFPAIQKAVERIEKLKTKLQKIKEQKDWLEEKDIEKAKNALDSAEEFVSEKKEENQKQDKSLDPTTRAQAVETRVKIARDAVKRLQKKKKPEEKKQEKKQEEEKKQDEKKQDEEKMDEQGQNSQNNDANESSTSQQNNKSDQTNISDNEQESQKSQTDL